jgi:hypothetical protein
VVEVPTEQRTSVRATVPLLALVAAAAVVASTWLVLDGRLRAGGVAALVAGLAMLVAALLLPRDGARRQRLILSLVDRAFDGAILSALAWETRDVAPATAAGALVALVAGFLAAYVRAKGASLGYSIDESLGTRIIRWGLVSAALLGGGAAWAVYADAILMLLATAVRTSQVAKEERE